MQNQSLRHRSGHRIGNRPAGGAQAPGRAAAERRARGGSCGRVRRLVAWLVLTVFYLTPPGVPVAWAAPEGMVVESGSATLTATGSDYVISTGTQQTIVGVDSIDVPRDESLHVEQPTSDSRFLAKVHPGAPPTDISGVLSSNAVVYILNTAGVFFGNEAVVDVGRLVAGAGQLSDVDFLAGRDHFTDLSGPVEVAAGARLQADSVALLGRTVANHGSILAPDGMIALVAGGEVLLTPLDGRVRVRVEAAPEDPGGWAIEQTGTLDAGGGSVMLAAGDAYSLAMNHTGITRGRDVQLEGGDGGLVAVAGTLDAASREPGGRGGSIRVLGERVAVLDAVLDASGDAGGGEIRVGGDLRGEGDLRTARRTYVSDEAVLRADALEQGDGGRVIVWADEKTGFYGALSARGGSAGGDGGFAEISGKLSLESRGDIDLSAPAGRSGALLYDPEEIEIVGGAPPDPGANPPDGDDVNDDPALLASDIGTAGLILFADVGDPDGVAPFTIYESEIEGTDADIFLEARRSVVARGTFDHQTVDEDGVQEGPNVVRLIRDNGLFIATDIPTDPESTEFAGIDLISNVDGQTLTWRVSGSGQIFLDTVPDEGASLPQAAPIRAGRLEAEGIDQVTDTSSAIAISLWAGATANDPAGPAIDVDEIRVNGVDAEAPQAEGLTPLAATAGGRIAVRADRGDVVIGRIEAIGGSALDTAENGGNGGLVEVEALDGNLTLRTRIDVSGGTGLAGTVGEGDAARAVGSGGRGGRIALCAGSDCDGNSVAEDARHVYVQGDLLARGGRAVANADTGEIADGGGAGVIQMVSETGDVYAGASADGPGPVTFDASGGDGSRAGGDGSRASGGLADLVGVSIGIEAKRDIALDAQIAASGGAGEDGAGGARGVVRLLSVGGSILSGTTHITADDGAGSETLAPPSSSEPDVRLEAKQGEVAIAGIAALGGDASGGADASAGGSIEIEALSIGVGPTGGASAGGLDASGGAASGTGSGGAGGSIALEASGDVRALVAEDAGASLAITQRVAEADTLLEFGDSAAPDLLARVDGAGTDPQTVRTLDTSQVDLAVSYRLDADASLVIAAPDAGAGTTGVTIGSAGATLASAGALEAGGAGAHVTTRGTAILEGTRIGNVAVPLTVEGLRDTPDAAPKLGLDAAGDVFVGLSAEPERALDAVDLRQSNPLASALIESFADADPTTALDAIDIRGQSAGAPGEEILSSHVVRANTRTGEFVFAYRVLPPAEDAASAAARVVIEQMDLGGDVVIQAVGDVQIGTDAPLGGAPPDVAIVANGNSVSLWADAPAAGASLSDGAGAIVDAGIGSAAIDMGDPGDGSAQLALRAGSGVGSAAAPLRTQHIGRLAGTTDTGGFHLENSVAGDVRVAQLTDVNGAEHTGITATAGHVDLANEVPGGRILFEALAAGGTHVTSGGDQTYRAPVEIENARFDVGTRYLPRRRGDPGRETVSVLTPSNEARLVAGGDVVFQQRVDSSDDALARFTRPGSSGGPDVEQFVPGALTVEAQGETRFLADVGSVTPLAALDVGDVRLPAGATTTFTVAGVSAVDTGPRIVIDAEPLAARAAFGRIDGASQLQVSAGGTAGALSRVTFRGDIGTDERLTGLAVEADRIEFSTAERVVTGEEGIFLNMPADPADDSATSGAPEVATIFDTAGSIAFETAGDFETGRLQKFSGLGGLSIQAQEKASFGDLAALSIRVDAQTILLKGRDPSGLLLADGSLASDTGGDLVANDIAFSSVPVWDGEGARPVFVLGSGGISAPASLSGFDVIRLDPAISRVSPASFVGPDGAVLDLTGSGPPLVGDPTQETPRPEPGPAPEPGPRVDGAPPAARPQASGEQLLALVHCGRTGAAAGPSCGPGEAGVAAPPGSALATQRAADIAARYRTLIANPDARARLRAGFKVALGAYRARAAGAAVDGSQLYAFLRESPAHAEILEQLNELARLFAEIEMLGLAPADTLSVQRALAREFAEAAGEPGFDAEAVMGAVRASAIGLPV